jgi:hypothetical protein
MAKRKIKRKKSKSKKHPAKKHVMNAFKQMLLAKKKL